MAPPPKIIIILPISSLSSRPIIEVRQRLHGWPLRIPCDVAFLVPPTASRRLIKWLKSLLNKINWYLYFLDIWIHISIIIKNFIPKLWELYISRIIYLRRLDTHRFLMKNKLPKISKYPYSLNVWKTNFLLQNLQKIINPIILIFIFNQILLHRIVRY